MLVGTADIDELAEGAPIIESWNPDAIEMPGVHCFQMTAEMKNSAREALLPPSLHPTVPATVSIQAWQIDESPWGAFDLVVCRVSCRSGVRARGFTTAALASSEEACAGLSGTFGFPASLAEIRFRHGYDGVDLEVSLAGASCLSVSASSPEPMGLGDVQYTGTLTLAETPKGLRLVQVEAQHVAEKVDRLQARLAHFDGRAFGNALLDPVNVVSASLCKESVTFPPVRFVCKVDELAFTGTEAI